MPGTKDQSKGATPQPPKEAKTDPKQQEALKKLEGQIKDSGEGERCCWSFERDKFTKLTNVKQTKPTAKPCSVSFCSTV
jgi:hypothetical protein